MTKPLQPYHFVWLAKHPERSKEWLCDRLADGFHVHHVDGDHANDSPDNLVLIEHGDHMDLHGLDLRKLARRAGSAPKPRRRRPSVRLEIYDAIDKREAIAQAIQDGKAILEQLKALP